MNSLILTLGLVFAVAPPTSKFQEGVELSRNGSHENSEFILEEIYPKTEQRGAYYFYRAVNAYNLNDKKGGLYWSDRTLSELEEVPERYREVAALMRFDLLTWPDKSNDDDLDDIAREMHNIHNRLKNGMSGPKTQAKQEDVLRRLKKNINDIEDKIAKAKEIADARERDADERRAAKERGSGRGQPAVDSDAGGETGRGEVDKKRVREIAANWGNLPEKERAKAVQELVRNLAPADRTLIINYFDRISRRRRR